MVDMDGPLMSSKETGYETPHDLFDNLNKEFGFTLDAAASFENAKCKTFYTEKDDGLSQPWAGNVWVNPPYGKYITDKWVKKAYTEAVERHAFICMLLPARTDTKWFHDYILNGGTVVEIRFVKGRLKFVGEKHAAPFPSMLVMFDASGGEVPFPYIYSCDKQGNIL